MHPLQVQILEIAFPLENLIMSLAKFDFCQISYKVCLSHFSEAPIKENPNKTRSREQNINKPKCVNYSNFVYWLLEILIACNAPV